MRVISQQDLGSPSSVRTCGSCAYFVSEKMPFPEAERVVYRQNPLDRVVCQLKFPPILKIEREIPVEFQDRIRKDFPGFYEKREPKWTYKGVPSPGII